MTPRKYFAWQSLIRGMGSGPTRDLRSDLFAPLWLGDGWGGGEPVTRQQMNNYRTRIRIRIYPRPRLRAQGYNPSRQRSRARNYSRALAALASLRSPPWWFAQLSHSSKSGKNSLA